MIVAYLLNVWGETMRYWTLEERQKQAELIQQWKPWKTAGVKTLEGKAISRMNAYKHGGRCAEMRMLLKQMAVWNKELNQIFKWTT